MYGILYCCPERVMGAASEQSKYGGEEGESGGTKQVRSVSSDRVLGEGRLKDTEVNPSHLRAAKCLAVCGGGGTGGR